MEAILEWQLGVVATIIIARLFSSGAMTLVALAWTAFTFLAVWANALVVLQLGSVWGSVWLLSALFGETVEKEVKTVQPSKEQKARKATIYAPREIPTAKTKNSTAARTSVLSTISSIADATTRFAEGLTQTLDDASQTLQLQQESLKTNSNLYIQLSTLKSSIQLALRVGEVRQEVNRKCEDPKFAKIYLRVLRESEDKSPRHSSNGQSNHPETNPSEFAETSTVINGTQKLDLKGITLSPMARDALGDHAASNRVKQLRGALEVVLDTQKRINREKTLLTAIDQQSQQAFSPFLSAQIKILEQHLAALVTPSAPRIPPQTTLLLKDAIPVRPQRPTRPSPGRISQQSTPAVLDAGGIFSSEVAATREPSVTLKAIARTNQKGTTVPPLANPAITRLHRDEIKNLAHDLGIPHLVHFTRCENLPTILEHGVMSIETCSHQRIDPVCNDTNRYDGQPDAISLSIAFPNYRMFYKYRAMFPATEWAVLLISSATLWEKDCGFYRNNAADARMIRIPREEMKSAQALRDMFSNDLARDSFLRPYDPSDPQAEVLCYDTIEPSHIEAIAFETREIRAKNWSILKGLESFYAGPNAGLFASRQQTRGN